MFREKKPTTKMLKNGIEMQRQTNNKNVKRMGLKCKGKGRGISSASSCKDRGPNNI
jgi:hypothetical protein